MDLQVPADLLYSSKTTIAFLQQALVAQTMNSWSDSEQAALVQLR